MNNKHFWSKLKSFAGEETNYCYIPYKDSKGHTLAPEEILFMTMDTYPSVQTVDVWDDAENEASVKFVTVKTPGVRYIYDDEVGNFPIALEYKGRHYYLKVSAHSHEVLPIHCGACPELDVILTGPTSSGKTVSIIQFSDETYRDMLVRDTEGFSFTNDLPVESFFAKRYEQIRAEMKTAKKLPDPTRRGETLLPYVFLVSYKNENGTVHRRLLKIQDIDGQYVKDLPWDDTVVSGYDYCFYTIPANELLALERGESVAFSKVLENMLPRLRLMRTLKDLHVEIVITKADLLKETTHPELQDALRVNSVRTKDRVIERVAHKDGVDMKLMEDRNRCIREYLKKCAPGFFANICTRIPEKNLHFSLIASIGDADNGEGHFVDYNPINIDEPILYLLAKSGLYPVKNNGPEEAPPLAEELVDEIEWPFKNKDIAGLEALARDLKKKCKVGLSKVLMD